jgi:hypothetical protein
LAQDPASACLMGGLVGQAPRYRQEVNQPSAHPKWTAQGVEAMAAARAVSVDPFLIAISIEGTETIRNSARLPVSID